MPVRVLHVVTYMCRGGLETFIMNYYRKIDRSKVQFDFLVHREFEADYDCEIQKLGGRIYRLPRLNPFSPVYLSKLDAFFTEHKEYKIVHSHLDCMAGIPLKYAKKHGVPVRIAHSHSSNQTKDWKYLLKLIFKRNIVRYATNLFACGRDAGQWMFATDNFQIIPNAIDSEKYVFDPIVRAEVRKELGIDEHSFVVGHVGRFAPPKNHAFLIDILSDVVLQRKDAVAILVGDGVLKVDIQQMVDARGLSENVIFTGVRADVHRLLQAMDVFVFPSVYEGLPVSLVEAQAAGLPCLISDKVPLECKKTDLVTQLPLEAGTQVWAKTVIETQSVPRANTLHAIRDSGFDIQQNAARLSDFYLERLQAGV